MNDKQKEVIRNIIYAVETGGQIYGKKDYANFTEAYTNSSAEHAITIGAGQWYGQEARKLLAQIHKADTDKWMALDHVGLLDDVMWENWDCYNIVTASQKAETIISIISTDAGIRCQDALMDEQMEIYMTEAASMGVTDLEAQAMCANFRHQGGYGAVRRIIGKTSKPYTIDALYQACKTDTGNQVGAYKARQKFVYESLKKKFPKEGGQMTKTEKAIRQMEAWAKDDSHGYDQKYRWGEKGDYDCSAAVIQAWENAGVPVKAAGATYTGDMYPVFTKKGFTDVTKKVNLKTQAGLKRGDVLLNKGSHVAMYCGNGKEVEASINEKGETTGGTPGDQTGKEFLIRGYRNYPWDCVLRYTGEEKADNTDTEAVAYVARIKADTICYTDTGKTKSTLFPKLKKDTVVDVMKHTEKDSSGNTWHLVRVPHPTEGFVLEFVKKGSFRHLT